MRTLRNGEVERVRDDATELGNHYIDEMMSGRLDRRQFLRRGSAIGLSASALAVVVAACGGANSTSSAAGHGAATTSGSVKRGGTLRVGSGVPTGAINPMLVSDSGGLAQLAMTGEFLLIDDGLTGRLEPVLATSFTHNANADVWTFKLRSGVRFHDGSPMTADDVVYTFKALSNPKSASNALSTFEGVLSPAGVHKVDDLTVEFHLDAPVGNFAWLVSSDNYNAIIVPKGTDFGTWHKTFIGTGPFTMVSYQQNQGSTFKANPHYWGPRPYLDTVAFTFYDTQQPLVLALQGGTIDVIKDFVPQGAESVLTGQYHVIKINTSTHRELSMRNDMAPFTDPRVRQAVALCMDRPAMVQALLNRSGQVGNDNPFAPVFPSTNTSVPQRVQDIAKAKALLQAAGHPNGFTTTLTTENNEEVPLLAQVMQQDCRKAGIDLRLKVETQATYYGKATFGNSDWLDAELSLVDYGGRGVPNLFLEAVLTTHGPWNAARFHNRSYDRLVKQYVGTPDLQSQRRIAGQIERLLLDQTPLVIPYFIDGLTATTTNVHGVVPTQIKQLFLGRASIA
jgi:peptide/nickel transport system substrate-binding protein